MRKLLAAVSGHRATATLHSRHGLGDEAGALPRTVEETRQLAAASPGRHASNSRHQG